MNPSLRTCAFAAGLLAAACRTTTASGPASRPGAREDAAPTTVYVSAVPTILVLPGDRTFLLLDGPVVRGAPDAPTLEVSYLASADEADGRRPEVATRAMATANLLFAAFDPVVAPQGVPSAVITASFGAPEGPGVGVSIRFARVEGRWVAAGAPETRRIVLPSLPLRVGRTVEGEGAALKVARRFIESVDGRDFEGAWELVSSVVKATTSRTSFEGELREATRSGAAGERAEASARAPCFLRYGARPDGFALGDDVEVCLAGPAGVDTVRVRLDDDQEWRVAQLSHLAPEARGRAGDASSGAQAVTAPRGPPAP
jgi:hypothetical protein